jgi:hypothetical protein
MPGVPRIAGQSPTPLTPPADPANTPDSPPNEQESPKSKALIHMLVQRAKALGLETPRRVVVGRAEPSEPRSWRV